MIKERLREKFKPFLLSHLHTSGPSLCQVVGLEKLHKLLDEAYFPIQIMFESHKALFHQIRTCSWTDPIQNSFEIWYYLTNKPRVPLVLSRTIVIKDASST